MGKIYMEKRKADSISNGVFLIGLGLLFFTGYWWPGILLAILATLAVRQFLTGRIWDLAISGIILLGLFIIAAANISLNVIMPLLFILGGAYLIFREYFYEDRVVPIDDAHTRDDSNEGHKDG